MHPQVLQYLWVEPAARPQLRQVILELLEDFVDPDREGGEVECVVCFVALLGGGGLFALGAAFLFLEEGRVGKRAVCGGVGSWVEVEGGGRGSEAVEWLAIVLL